MDRSTPFTILLSQPAPDSPCYQTPRMYTEFTYPMPFAQCPGIDTHIPLAHKAHKRHLLIASPAPSLSCLLPDLLQVAKMSELTAFSMYFPHPFLLFFPFLFSGSFIHVQLSRRLQESGDATKVTSHLLSCPPPNTGESALTSGGAASSSRC